MMDNGGVGPLAKTRVALSDARTLVETAEKPENLDEHGLIKLVSADALSRILRFAELQTLLSIAESLEKISKSLEAR